MSVFGHGSLIYILQWRFSARSKLVVLWKWWPLFYRLQCLMTCNEKKLFFTLFIVTWGCLNVSESESHVCDFWAGRTIVVYKLKWGHNQCILRNTYTKIGTIQRRLAWPLRKDDTQIREAFHIFFHKWFFHIYIEREQNSDPMLLPNYRFPWWCWQSISSAPVA